MWTWTFIRYNFQPPFAQQHPSSGWKLAGGSGRFPDLPCLLTPKTTAMTVTVQLLFHCFALGNLQIFVRMFISFPLKLADSLKLSRAFDLQRRFSNFNCLPRLSWKRAAHISTHWHPKPACNSLHKSCRFNAFWRSMRPKCWNKTP